jgi:[acyl-carrier-protein] S-malonyltransferase
MTARTALVFPGQGSQRPGMAIPWQDHAAWLRWEEASAVLGWDVTGLGLRADAGELRQPANCQVALFVHEVVLLETWTAQTGEDPVAVAGHSLGEYVALVAAGVLGFADGLRLVDARAGATQAAADAAPGTMVACLGFPVEDVRAACVQAGAHLVNDNAPGQVVVAGSVDALGRLRAVLGGDGGRDRRGKVVDLEVGAAYHSPHMAAAVEPFGTALDAATFADARVPVVANVDAAPHTAAGEWPELLRRQLVAPVRWRQTVQTLVALGASRVIELCASPVLTGLVKRTDRSIVRHAVAVPDDLRAVAGATR